MRHQSTPQNVKGQRQQRESHRESRNRNITYSQIRTAKFALKLREPSTPTELFRALTMLAMYRLLEPLLEF
jgi:hypothetical protein